MQLEPLGGPGTGLAWTVAGGAPVNTLSNAAYTYSPFFSVWNCDQIAILGNFASVAGVPTATMRLRWAVSSTIVDFDEVIEAPGAQLAGPPAAQQYTLMLKEWGPIPTSVDGRKYALPRPVEGWFVSVGILWSAAPAGVDAVTLWLARQVSPQMQGPAS
jgi:hypothetical protein